jgi:hypothetical protein
MRRDARKTLIGVIRDHVSVWRKQSSWSRETVAGQIVAAHAQHGGPANTGIRFEPPSQDVFEQMKANADRVFRWLDDDTKDTNLLPANFLPSVLAAMPLDLRLSCVDDFLRPLGIVPALLDAAGDPQVDTASLLQGLMKEGGEANQALLSVISDGSAGNLLRARKELAESVKVHQDAISAIDVKLGNPGQ